ncbi:MAG: GTPase HflX [Clostridiales bacterium]|nr:GTPase HflX [Clostridiales bacterium]MDD6293416.1 GTPase HflX [Eubacteriales bacterium]
MEKLYETQEETEKVILIGVSTSDGDDTEESLMELKELVKTAGATTVVTVIQNREAIHAGTYIGKGKIEEVKILIDELGATGVVCDDELSPAQLMNLRDALDTKVMDRTLIILDIFASRAKTGEGKVQVELAQLKYRQARLVGLRSSLSRLGGGIGTRGPGEKKLEMDRRLIKDRIAVLRREVEEMKVHRELARNQRSKNPTTVISIVGYTNAGKSTLLNELTGAGVLEENKLFATLDPTTRKYKLESGQEIMLTDTVGFIRKLPHHLIDAFRSTLEEAKYADILIHVVDASNPQMDAQMHIVYETLDSLGVTDKSIITIFNKQDKVAEQLESNGETEMPVFKDFRADYTLNASIKNHTGLDKLLEYIEEILRNKKIYIAKTFEYKEAGQIQKIRKYGELLKEEYRDDGIYVEAYVPVELMPI